MSMNVISVPEVDQCQKWNLKKTVTWNVLHWSKKMRLILSAIRIKQVHLKQEMMLQEVFALSFKRMVHVCEETVSTFILIVQQHILMLGLLEGKVVKQVPGLDQCQELKLAGTELKIIFAIVIVIKVTVGLVQNADSVRIKYLCLHIKKDNSYHDPNVNKFLEEMKNVLNTLKGIVEMQHQPTSFLFTNVQGYQHQQFIPATSQAQHVWPASCSDALDNKPTSNSLRTKKGKRKVRRGLRKRKGDGSEKSSGICNSYCPNVNGFKSKADSINQIILEHNIDVVLLCETKVYSNSAIGIRGFHSFPAVKQKNCSGGLYIGIRHGYVSQS